MNRFSLVTVFLFFAAVSASANIIVDCRGLAYTNVLASLQAGEFGSAAGILVTPPFKTYPRSDIVYDYSDSGTAYQQGSLLLPCGTLAELKTLHDACRSRSLQLLSFVKLFEQRAGYKLSVWRSTDFLPDEENYNDTFIVDIDAASGKLGDAVRLIQRTPVDSWIVPVDDVPDGRIADYARFVQRSFPSGYVYTDSGQINRNLVSSRYYWSLRRNNFMMPLACFTNIAAPDTETVYHFVASDETSINNVATALYMLSIRLNVILPEAFFHSDSVATMIGFLNQGTDFKTKIVNDKIMILYSSKKIIAFNLSDSLSMTTTPAYVREPGNYRSLFGGSFIRSDGTKNDFFLLPRSVYVWSIR